MNKCAFVTGVAMNWTLDEIERKRARELCDSVDYQLFLPVDRLQEINADEYSIDAGEILFLIWTVQDLTTGRLDNAFERLETKLLPRAAGRHAHWLAAIRLWCALCKLYLCDADGVLEHIVCAEQEGVVATMEYEYTLTKGLALRLKGDFDEAERCLQSIELNDAVFRDNGDIKLQILSALAETMLVRGQTEYAQANMEYINRRMNSLSRARAIVMGIPLAAAYRFCTVLDATLLYGETKEDILVRMDEAPAFLRPLLTTLLEDILPRPLVGVVRK